MSAQPSRRRSAARVFAIPALIGAASVIGLIVALVGEGAHDLAGWAFLAAPVAAAAWARLRRT